MKNLCAKMRTKENPYEVWEGNGWTWLVLKKWQADDNKPYARWFCAVSSPFTQGGYDMGDVYVAEIKRKARKVSDNNTVKAADETIRNTEMFREGDYEPVPKKNKQPSMATIERWMMDGIAKATDGCTVEPDGICSHGKRSWLIELGIM